jgi:hypothetical protein
MRWTLQKERQAAEVGAEEGFSQLLLFDAGAPEPDKEPLRFQCFHVTPRGTAT